MRRWTVVLVSPKEGGNVGAAARVMRNFGAARLRVVDPRCEVNGEEARRFSSGAADLLRAATIHSTLAEALAGCELAIGLTGVSGRHHRLDCTGLVPARLLENRNVMRSGALVFGREERGLGTTELELCDYLWSLPSDPDFPSLNLAQAIGVALAGLAEAERQVGHAPEVGLGLAPSVRSVNPLVGVDRDDDRIADTDRLIRMTEHLLELMRTTGWTDETRARNAANMVRNVMARAVATEREVAVIHGLCRHALGALAHGAGKAVGSSDSQTPDR